MFRYVSGLFLFPLFCSGLIRGSDTLSETVRVEPYQKYLAAWYGSGPDIHDVDTTEEEEGLLEFQSFWYKDLPYSDAWDDLEIWVDKRLQQFSGSFVDVRDRDWGIIAIRIPGEYGEEVIIFFVRTGYCMRKGTHTIWTNIYFRAYEDWNIAEGDIEYWRTRPKGFGFPRTLPDVFEAPQGLKALERDKWVFEWKVDGSFPKIIEMCEKALAEHEIIYRGKEGERSAVIAVRPKKEYERGSFYVVFMKEFWQKKETLVHGKWFEDWADAQNEIWQYGEGPTYSDVKKVKVKDR